MLNGPTACSLKAGGFSTLMMDLATGVVLPEDKVCHTVPVQDGYVVVKVDHIHQNAEPIPLDIPMPDADIFTLGDARTMQIQWKKSAILILPINRSIASSSGQPSATADQKRPCAPTHKPVKDVAAGSPPK
jgi:hypothetical protein